MDGLKIEKCDYLILGAGLAGVSFSYFLKKKNIIILEKESEIGGLCKSFKYKNIFYDIGPHIIFSKDKTVLNNITAILNKNINLFRRSNKIFFKGKLVKYPFENDLSSLPIQDRNYCLKTFLNNPYANIKPQNMLEYFLKTFGEGITNTYLKPYNEKIWKFGLSKMDTQMVERIPKPPAEDILKSANGISTEGYLHQLNFYYPKKDGIQSLVKAYASKFNNQKNIRLNEEIISIKKYNDYWLVITNKSRYLAKKIINTLPLFNFIKLVDKVPQKIRQKSSNLLYNSIIIVFAIFDKDTIGNNFAIYIPDKSIIFHRISKLNYFGSNYSFKNKTSLLIEITYRLNDKISKLTDSEIKNKVVNCLGKIGFINKKDLFFIKVHHVPYAYVIYDLKHRKNTDLILNYLKSLDIETLGRFGEFEYLNMDQVIKNAKKLADKYIKH